VRCTDQQRPHHHHHHYHQPQTALTPSSPPSSPFVGTSAAVGENRTSTRVEPMGGIVSTRGAMVTRDSEGGGMSSNVTEWVTWDTVVREVGGG
jgi:hypothetical protein